MKDYSFWYCDNIDLYSILCPPKLRDFQKEHYKQFGQGDLIYLEKDTAQKVYMVSKGKVKIAAYNEEGVEIVKAILTKGELFGEMVILGEEKRQDFAIALSKNTAVCPMTVDKMYGLMRDNKRFNTFIYKLIGFRVRKLERRLERILFKDATTRLKDFINELAVELGDKMDNCILIKHPYTQNDMANLLGLRRETVNVLFQEFKEAATLDYKRYQISIYCPNWQSELGGKQHLMHNKI